MSMIAPTVLAETADDYRAQIERVHGFAERVHIDISDGEFAPSFTLGAAQIWWPQGWIVDIHAMVARPSDHLETLVNLKPNMIIFHAETQEDIVPVLAHVKKFGIKAGIALLKSTVPSTVASAIQAADHVMIFSGELGKYGGTASLMQLEKVRLIRAIRQDVEIGWDGGVNVENAFSLAQGGIDVLNVGGTIATANDPKSVYATLVSEINKHGII
ncbi:MAG: rpe, Ribulose-phosphate 3-epimerase [Candidatus Saccharibacteria bacterium]|jgi:ribulose-phosphate 3-epimerase|nr:rpe, Ribulose-phosphate 3-epimerase [Candidatus Saccharibacteria bacterium]